MLSWKQPLTIYKTFVRSHLDYADITFDKPFNDSSKNKKTKKTGKKFDSLQYLLLLEQ